MEISSIVNSFTESVIREMTRICDEVDGINLSQGFPDFAAPSDIKEEAIKAIRNDINQYAVTFGNRNLREEIAEKFEKFNEVAVNPEDEITVTCGATEAMVSTLKAITNPGDEVIIFEPFYENYGPDSILSGAIPRFVTLHPPEWGFDLEQLRKMFNEKTKAIIINTPNNPTGKVFTRDELEVIADLCKEWDCLAICDEIYEHIIYDNQEHISMASLEGMKNRTITINSISKTYSLTGWRVGWAIANPEITKAIRTVHDFLTVGAPAPLQEAAAYALTKGDEYYQGLRDRYKWGRGFMYDALVKAGFEPYIPQGAYYFIANVRNLMGRFNINDDFEFSRFLIEKAKVATVPGTSFYSDKAKGIHQVRFCFCKTKETLEMAANNLLKLHNTL